MSQDAQWRDILCPFYGRYTALMLLGGGSIPRQGLQFINSGGNQCALVLQSAHPCEQQAQDKPIDWRTCPVWLASAIMPHWRP